MIKGGVSSRVDREFYDRIPPRILENTTLPVAQYLLKTQRYIFLARTSWFTHCSGNSLTDEQNQFILRKV